MGTVLFGHGFRLLICPTLWLLRNRKRGKISKVAGRVNDTSAEIRSLLWYNWAYMLLRTVAHSKTYIEHMREIACWNGCAGPRQPNGLVFLTDRRRPGDKVGFCQACILIFVDDSRRNQRKNAYSTGTNTVIDQMVDIYPLVPVLNESTTV